MDLFNAEKISGLLPYDGTATYYGRILPIEEADIFLAVLSEKIAWKNDEAVIFGRHIITKRKVAWYGDADYAYTYSKTTRQALPWTPELKTLQNMAEAFTGATFNSCLLNLYHSGSEGVGWHSDDEKSLAPNGVIASFSFGAERKFSFRHKKTNQAISVLLAHGSLLVMEGTTQTHWLHSLPKSLKIKSPRVNLTFRQMVTG